jgi:hypothetical protein
MDVVAAKKQSSPGAWGVTGAASRVDGRTPENSGSDNVETNGVSRLFLAST